MKPRTIVALEATGRLDLSGVVRKKMGWNTLGLTEEIFCTNITPSINPKRREKTMKRSIKLLGAMAGLVLMMSFGVQKAQANHETLFPHIVNTATEESVLTLIDPGAAAAGSTEHIQYWTKSITAANTDVCVGSSVFVDFTTNDMMTWGVGATFGPLGPLFGDTQTAALGVNMSGSDQHGYAIVSGVGGKTGYQLDIDFGGGSVTSTHAHTIGWNDDALADARGIGLGPVPTDAMNWAALGVPVAFLPPGTAAAPTGLSTSFKVTPLSDTMFTAGNAAATVQLSRVSSSSLTSATITQGAFDRNENQIDSTIPVDVVCVADLTLTDLMPTIVANDAWAAVGGWAYFNVLNTTGLAGQLGYAAVVYQVDGDSTGAFKTTTEISNTP